ALDQFLARAGQLGLFVKIRPAAALDAARDAVENLDAFQWIFAHGSFAAEHDGVGLLEDGVGHVGDLRAGWHGAFNHALEHMRRDNDRPAGAQAGFDNLALDDGQLFVGQFDAQIAARDHDRVGLGDDGMQVVDGLLVLDLGDDQRAMLSTFDDGFQLLNVFCLADKRQREVINPQLKPHFDIDEVLGGQSGKTDSDSRQIDMAAASERAFGEDFTLDFVAVFGQELHLNRAVVQQHHVAEVDVPDEILVVHIDGMEFLAVFAADGEREFLARLEVKRGGQVAGPDSRALRVHHDTHGAVAVFGGGADVANHALDPVRRRVRLVEVENVQP